MFWLECFRCISILPLEQISWVLLPLNPVLKVAVVQLLFQTTLNSAVLT